MMFHALILRIFPTFICQAQSTIIAFHFQRKYQCITILISNHFLFTGKYIADPANVDQAAENQEQAAAAGNENQQGAEGEGNRPNWLGGIMKEVQLVVVGFVASLLPGFQHND
jgi:hypothetical protein